MAQIQNQRQGTFQAGKGLSMCSVVGYGTTVFSVVVFLLVSYNTTIDIRTR
jgi:hypothetical protein